MSASPSQAPVGPSTSTPTSGPPGFVPRKKRPVNIFTTKKKPPLRKPGTATTSAPNGASASTAKKPSTSASGPVKNGPSTAGGAADEKKEEENKDYQDYAIYILKSSFTKDRHHHAMKLQARLGPDGAPLEVNPYKEDQFTRPLRLHRRHARDKIEVAEQSDAASGVDDKEREILNARRAERKAEREANQALIAPTGPEVKKPVKKKPQKKVEDVYYNPSDPKQRQRAQLRYEEARPWHLEDFDNKNVWVGSYEEPLSETSVLFELHDDGFSMVPVEKWYKFSQSNRVNVMDSDAVEKHMGKKFKPPRWFLGTQAANDDERRREATAQRERQRAQMRRVDDDEMKPNGPSQEYRADVDEIDFEFNDEFQDDDEGMMFGDQQEDDAKDIERRIREEMRSANLAGTGVKDEDRDWDEEEQKERREEQEEKRRTKRMRKQLIKKERKNEYDSESDHGEFSEDSETEDSEEERERERLEEERKQEEVRKMNGEKSGASSKGTNTPTGRLEKKDPTRLGPSLKRPGSPDLSEVSGNEASRKKPKVVNGSALAANARSLSPDSKKPKIGRTGTGGGYGSGSDTDASRAGGRNKLRLKNSPVGSPASGTPAGSRAGSPAAVSPPPKSTTPSFPTLQEVRDAIPPGGIVPGDLINLFRDRVQKRSKNFIELVKQAGRQDPATKKIMPK